QRRVFEVLAVLLKLRVGGVERRVLALALVLDGEVAAIPHVGVALLAAGLLDARLEGEELAGRVEFGRRGVPHQPAEVHEMFLVAGALFQFGARPLVDELLGRKCPWHNPSACGEPVPPGSIARNAQPGSDVPRARAGGCANVPTADKGSAA